MYELLKKNEFRWIQIGASGDTELFEKASNINGFQGGRVANNLYISPFRATVFKTAALFPYLNSSVVIRVQKPLFFLSDRRKQAGMCVFLRITSERQNGGFSH